MSAPNPANGRETAAPRYLPLTGDIERDRDAIIAVWDGAIGWANRLPEMYDVFYRDCPFGQPVLRILQHQPDQTTVGTFALGRRRMLWRGREIRAGVFAHLAVRPEHRRVKPAIALLDATMEAGREHFDVVYGLPSAKGAAMSKLGGYRPAARFVRHVKLLRYQPYARRFLPGVLATAAGACLDTGRRTYEGMQHAREQVRLHEEWTTTTDPRMGELWRRTPHGDALTAIRDYDLLHWRFDRLPSQRRRYLLLSEHAGGPLVAWFACDANVREPGMLSINDFWSEKGVHGVDRQAIRALSRVAYRDGFHAIELRFAGSDGVLSNWRAEGYRERDSQPLFVVWLNPELAGDVSGHLHITDIDNDG